MEPPVCCPKCRSAWWRRGSKRGNLAKTDSAPLNSSPCASTFKVPVPIVGSAYKPKSAIEVIGGRTDKDYQDYIEATARFDMAKPKSTAIIVDGDQEISEVYGIPPPPSLVNKLKREQAEQERTESRIVEQTKPISAHVLDPNELTEADQARLDALVVKANKLAKSVVENVDSKGKESE